MARVVIYYLWIVVDTLAPIGDYGASDAPLGGIGLGFTRQLWPIGELTRTGGTYTLGAV